MTDRDHESLEPELLPSREAMSIIPTDPNVFIPPDGWDADVAGGKADSALPTDPDGPPDEEI